MFSNADNGVDDVDEVYVDDGDNRVDVNDVGDGNHVVY